MVSRCLRCIWVGSGIVDCNALVCRMGYIINSSLGGIDRKVSVSDMIYWYGMV